MMHLQLWSLNFKQEIRQDEAFRSHSTQHTAHSTQHTAIKFSPLCKKVPGDRTWAARFISVLFAIIFGSVSSISVAQDDPASGIPAVSAVATAASGVPATAPTDEYDWKGDRIQLLTDVKNIKATESNLNYFAPDGAVFIVSNDDKSNRIAGKFVNVKPCNSDGSKSTKICIEPSVGLPLLGGFFESCISNKESDKARDVPPHTTPVESHGLYILDKAAVEKMPHKRYGWTMGGLIVPFKYQLSDKSFSGTTSIGPYVGYRFQDNSGSVTPVISAGWVSNIPVATGSGGGTSSASGFSWSAGVIFSVGKGSGIQFGVLAGQDRVGSSAPNPYKYEGDTWLSMAIGYKVF